MIRSDILWHLWRQLHVELYVFLISLETKHAMQIIEQAIQVEIRFVEAEPTGFDFRHFQHVVNQAEQMIATGINGAQILLLIGGDVGVAPHQLSKPNDHIERGAQLVAHMGEKAALGLVSRFCDFFGLG